ncbi:putative membrane protein of ExoQ family [Actinokineospora spheciospongiae]|uniref:Putative membrane protein of ExoQ family n=1 Tax=Actinokineospora spheciospongiae TaxID=909613 RepID=W7IED5_9PSEU|nr:O-antigen ligase family protein [Actinokineospora spheciospongiae]EWC59220.1 putative membrane protein of ExoQ family [Actinokineospora spheciospongiae]
MSAPPLVARGTRSAATASTWWLRALACAAVALAPVEGYLTAVHGQLAKLAPALLIVSYVVVRVRQRRVPLVHPLHLVLAALTALLLVSAAAHTQAPFAWEYTQRWLPFLVLTALLVDLAAREVTVRALMGAYVCGAVVAGAGALYSLVVEGSPRATGPLQDPNDLAFVLAVALPLLIALRPGRGVRGAPVALLVGAAVVLLAGMAATFSRGGGLALLAAGTWLLARRALPPRAVAVAFTGLAALVAAAVATGGQVLARALQEKSFIAASNVDTREIRWRAALRMLAENPVLGVGPGGFRSGYAAFSHNAEIAEQTPVAHNMFIEVAAELGLPAFALFAGMAAVALVAAERVLRAGADRAPMLAVQAGLIATAVASCFLSEQYYLPLWLLAALAAAADLRVRRRKVLGAGSSRDQ